ncbi:cytochrome P450 [Sistotremastrum suecicum HHB10207 ss-3]|uniref:Cytochrome P450 n=1 Tax=Sistotremastrum suecicum HHB10207 ss-3 TaxID=1314776 RepID=A0A166A017_9AGAM|nr:cytochrome P450 [Sistotremastrum suecicum HHB10207 ss-3]
MVSRVATSTYLVVICALKPLFKKTFDLPSIPWVSGILADRDVLVYELLGIGFLFLILFRTRRHSNASPPGPRGSIFSGNRSVIIGRKDIWAQYAEWARIYGPVFSLKANQLNIIVLNSAKALHDLLDGRSKIYSDRPTLIMNELLKQDKFLIRLTSRSSQFPLYRRMAHEELGIQKMSRHLPALENHVKLLLKDLLSHPEHFKSHLRICQSRNILKTIYGHTVESRDDYFVNLIEQRMKVLNSFMRTGAWLVDSYPILRHIPQWMPGGGFQKFVSEKRARNEEVVNLPYEWTKSQVKAGAAYPSLVANQVNREKLSAEHEEVIKHVAVTMYVAGVDTVLSTLLTFLLVMTLNPECQIRAQKEIDSVVGSDRLPRLSDRDKLPYVDALIKEVLRFHPPAPLGLNHAVTQDDEYDGMFIRKNSTVVPNIWAVTRDDSIYPEPTRFDPTRYLIRKQSSELECVQTDPRKFVFGFGRRICAGKILSGRMHFAETSVFLQISSILATLTISKERDGMDSEIAPVVDFTGGIISLPEDFLCKISPRSDAAIDLIMWDH